MRSEVRPPLTVEETGPQFNHCHISDIWNNMSGSGVWVGFVRLGLVRLGWVACPVGMGQGGMGHGSGRDGSGWGWVRAGWVRAGWVRRGGGEWVWLSRVSVGYETSRSFVASSSSLSVLLLL